MLKTYAINLPRCRERKEHILAECARFGLEPEILPAVDGAEISDSDFRRLAFEPDRNPFGKMEIGCALSHCGVYRDMVEKDVPAALVLEDDAVFVMDPRPFLAAMERLTDDAPGVYLLSPTRGKYIDGKPRRIGDIGFHRGWSAADTYGYVITRNAAAGILAYQTPVRCASDMWKLFQFLGLIRFYVCDNTCVRAQSESQAPSLMGIDRAASQVGRMRYISYLRKQAPWWLHVKYYLHKLRNFHEIRRGGGGGKLPWRATPLNLSWRLNVTLS